MRNRSETHPFSEKLELRKRQLEYELARIPDAASRARLVQQIKEIEAAGHMEGWLRSSQLRPPECTGPSLP